MINNNRQSISSKKEDGETSHFNPNGVYYANRKKIQLEKSICKHFFPFHQFFVDSPWARIIKSKPGFTRREKSESRNRLFVDRQLMHMKNLQLNVEQNYMEGVIQEEMNNQGLFKSKGNKSMIFGDSFYYGYQNKLKKFHIQDSIQESQQRLQIRQIDSMASAEFNDSIRQMKPINESILIRFPRRFVIFHEERKIQLEKRYGSEIVEISCQRIGEKVKQVNVSTYENGQSSIYKVDLNKDKNILAHFTNGLVRSHWSLTNNQLYGVKDYEIFILDKRKKQQNCLFNNKSNPNERIFSGIALNHQTFGRYLITSESRNFKIYDVRYCKSHVKQIRHYCEESPPSILQIYEPNEHQNLQILLNQINESSQRSESIQNTILVAHSPYELGSTLFTEINAESESIQNLTLLDNYKNLNENKCQLLFDLGKVERGYFNESISFDLKGDQIKIFSVDNYGGVSIEVLQKKIKSKYTKSVKNRYQKYQRVNLVCDSRCKILQSSNSEWFQNNFYEKYLETIEETNQFTESSIKMDDEDELNQLDLIPPNIQQRKANFVNLHNFYHKLFEKSKSIIIPQGKIHQSTKKNINTGFTFTSTFQQSERQQVAIKSSLITQDLIEELYDSWQLE